MGLRRLRERSIYRRSTQMTKRSRRANSASIRPMRLVAPKRPKKMFPSSEDSLPLQNNYGWR